MTTTSTLSPVTLAGLRDRVLADAGEAETTALEALEALTDPELAAFYYGYAKAAQDAEEGRRGDLHARAASHALDAAGALDAITPAVRAQVRSELTAALR